MSIQWFCQLYINKGVEVPRVLVPSCPALCSIACLRGSFVRVSEVQVLGQVKEAERTQSCAGHAFQQLWIVWWQSVGRAIEIPVWHLRALLLPRTCQGWYSWCSGLVILGIISTEG